MHMQQSLGNPESYDSVCLLTTHSILIMIGPSGNLRTLAMLISCFIYGLISTEFLYKFTIYCLFFTIKYAMTIDRGFDSEVK